MARPLYSTQLLAWSSDETPPPVVVPTGYRLILRDVDVWSGGGAMINFQLEVVEGAKFWAGQFTVESLPQVAQWRGRQVVNPGQVLAFTSDGPLDGLMSGYLLSID